MTLTRNELTSAQRLFLVGMLKTGDAYSGCRGRSEFGGRRRTIGWAIRHKLASFRKKLVLTVTGQRLAEQLLQE